MLFLLSIITEPTEVLGRQYSLFLRLPLKQCLDSTPTEKLFNSSTDTGYNNLVMLHPLKKPQLYSFFKGREQYPRPFTWSRSLQLCLVNSSALQLPSISLRPGIYIKLTLWLSVTIRRPPRVVLATYQCFQSRLGARLHFYRPVFLTASSISLACKPKKVSVPNFGEQTRAPILHAMLRTFRKMAYFVLQTISMSLSKVFQIYVVSQE